MTIRTRLTLWYAALLLVALLLIAGWTYYEMFVENRPPGAKPMTMADGDSALEEIGEVMLFGGLPGMLLALVGGWFLMRRALSPVTRLTQAIERIHTGNLSQRLPCAENGDELDRLTQVFNDMTARLDESFQRIREFTLHASHELKTPLTILHASLETALKEEVLNGDQRERIGSQLEELRRLAKIVDGLTLLTKADAGLVSLAREPLRLDELVRETFEDVHILAQQRSIEAALLPCDEATVSGDRNRLRQLLLNLADNAIKYNHAGGRLTMAVRREAATVAFVITNTGPGLAPELQARVFDRFFRGDASHNNEVDGCGLGLSIARCIAQLHDGTIEFQSQPGRETMVRVRLPRTPETAPAKAPAAAGAAPDVDPAGLARRQRARAVTE
jgi:signal transduction histidine kinase